MMSTSDCRLSVVIASRGRPDELLLWREILGLQTFKPSTVVLSVSSILDLPSHEYLPDGAIITFGPAGSSRQRNRGLDLVKDNSDLIAFFDDDYVPTPTCFERIAGFMAEHTDVVGANGLLLADGINSKGLSFHDALQIIEKYETRSSPVSCTINDLVGLYGCNMVYRATAIGSLRFDEKLPLYSWQEDIDFAVRVGLSGRIVRTNAFAGVHLGVKKARGSGLKLGYSQIANPVYLIRKRTMPLFFGLRLMCRNFLSNHFRIIRSEPWIDRKGRARGNWIAIKDVILGKSDPEKVVSLDDD